MTFFFWRFKLFVWVECDTCWSHEYFKKHLLINFCFKKDELWRRCGGGSRNVGNCSAFSRWSRNDPFPSLLQYLITRKITWIFHHKILGKPDRNEKPAMKILEELSTPLLQKLNFQVSIHVSKIPWIIQNIIWESLENNVFNGKLMHNRMGIFNFCCFLLVFIQQEDSLKFILLHFEYASNIWEKIHLQSLLFLLFSYEIISNHKILRLCLFSILNIVEAK